MQSQIQVRMRLPALLLVSLGSMLLLHSRMAMGWTWNSVQGRPKNIHRGDATIQDSMGHRDSFVAVQPKATFEHAHRNLVKKSVENENETMDHALQGIDIPDASSYFDSPTDDEENQNQKQKQNLIHTLQLVFCSSLLPVVFAMGSVQPAFAIDDMTISTGSEPRIEASMTQIQSSVSPQFSPLSASSSPLLMADTSSSSNAEAASPPSVSESYDPTKTMDPEVKSAEPTNPLKPTNESPPIDVSGSGLLVKKEEALDLGSQQPIQSSKDTSSSMPSPELQTPSSSPDTMSTTSTKPETSAVVSITLDELKQMESETAPSSVETPSTPTTTITTDPTVEGSTSKNEEKILFDDNSSGDDSKTLPTADPEHLSGDDIPLSPSPSPSLQPDDNQSRKSLDTSSELFKDEVEEKSTEQRITTSSTNTESNEKNNNNNNNNNPDDQQNDFVGKEERELEEEEFSEHVLSEAQIEWLRKH